VNHVHLRLFLEWRHNARILFVSYLGEYFYKNLRL